VFELIFFGGVIGLSWALLPSGYTILITLLGIILGVLSFIQRIRIEKLKREIREDIKETRELIKENEKLIQESSRETKIILDKMDERAEQRHREIMKEIIVK